MAICGKKPLVIQMKNLAKQRCANHASREAAARCPDCGRFFCRECVSEHDDRLLCAQCLAKLARTSFSKRYHLAGVVNVMRMLLGIFALWWCFYLIGQALPSIPDTFHEGTLW